MTLVARDDTRLVADIEKLIKKKIEIEPIEIEDDRQRRYRPREDSAPEAVTRSAERHAEQAIERAAERPARRPAPASRDPFFDKPYEPSNEGGAAWEKAAAPAAAKPGMPNIRPKKKVASLLGGGS